MPNWNYAKRVLKLYIYICKKKNSRVDWSRWVKLFSVLKFNAISCFPVFLDTFYNSMLANIGQNKYKDMKKFLLIRQNVGLRGKRLKGYKKNISHVRLLILRYIINKPGMLWIFCHTLMCLFDTICWIVSYTNGIPVRVVALFVAVVLL